MLHNICSSILKRHVFGKNFVNFYTQLFEVLTCIPQLEPVDPVAQLHLKQYQPTFLTSLTTNQMAEIGCQSLPDRPCPLLRCDATEHNTQNDLFLCHDCERTRDEALKKQSASQKQKRQKADPINAAPKVDRKQPARHCKGAARNGENSPAVVNSLTECVPSTDVNQYSKAEPIESSEVLNLKAEVQRLTGLVT